MKNPLNLLQCLILAFLLDRSNSYLPIDDFVIIESDQIIISISKNAYLTQWYISQNDIVTNKCIQLNMESLSSIAYKKGENYFTIPSVNGTIELRYIKTLKIIILKESTTKDKIDSLSYTPDGKYLYVAESWSLIYTLDTNFNTLNSKQIDDKILKFSFDYQTRLVGTTCYDQNTFDVLYSIDKEKEIQKVEDYFREWKINSSGIYNSDYLICFTSYMEHYNYDEKLKPTINWHLDISYLRKDGCCGHITYINDKLFALGYENCFRNKESIRWLYSEN